MPIILNSLLVHKIINFVALYGFVQGHNNGRVNRNLMIAIDLPTYLIFFS